MNEILKQLMILLSAITSILGIREEKFGATTIETPKIELQEKKYTKVEYDIYKIDLIDKVKKDKLTYYEKEDWIDILDRECRGIILSDVNSNNLKNKLNDALEIGC